MSKNNCKMKGNFSNSISIAGEREEGKLRVGEDDEEEEGEGERAEEERR